MRIAFVIYTPGQEHLWRFPILQLKENGHEVLVLARNDGPTCELLHSHGIQFISFGNVGKTSILKILQYPIHFLKSFNIIGRFKPDIIIGVGIIEVYTAFLLRKPCIIFEDSEPIISLERSLYKPLATVIITPESFKLDFGTKHVRFAGYKELAYLHPNHFKADPAIYDELKIQGKEKYVILRFNAFDAVHDIGRHGFSRDDQFRLVNEISKYARVFISPEAKLPDELEKYRLPIAYNRIHHALYYANLLVTDTGTMATEAAVLGTPTILCLSNYMKFGNFIELEQKYDLIYAFKERELAVKKAVELIQQSDLKKQWTTKRENLLADKIDVTQFMVDFIENYPDSFQNYKIKSNKR